MAQFLDVWVQVAATSMGETIGASASFSPAESHTSSCDTVAFSAEFNGALQGRLILKTHGLLKDLLGAPSPGDWPQFFERVTSEATARLTREHGLPVNFNSIPPPVATSEGTAYTVEINGRSIPLLIIDETREILLSREADTTRKNESGRESTVNSQGMDLLLDVELEASLRFGSREMPLSQVVELGPGDVVQLDRHISDPVDLVVGDKIVARGEVVLVNGNFGLRVTEVAEPHKRLESIRCLF